jgi:hypothetical protein
MIRRFFYGPPAWIVRHTNAEDRRMVGFWTFVISVSLAPMLGDVLYYLTGISLIALIPNFTAETPVENE